MVANKGLKRKSFAPQNQTPKSPNLKTVNKSPVKKLKLLNSPAITPKQTKNVQSPKLKSSNNSPAKNFQKLTKSPKPTKPIQVQSAKKTPSKQKKIPLQVEEDDSEDPHSSDLENDESEQDFSLEEDDDVIEGEEDVVSSEDEENAISNEDEEDDVSNKGEEEDVSSEGEENEVDDDSDGEQMAFESESDENEDEDVPVVEKKVSTSPAVKSDEQQKANKSKFVLFVGHLDFKAKEGEVRKYFEQAGKVVRVNLVKFRGDLSRGYGFVTLKNEAGFKKALALNHTSFGGRQINVEAATEKSTKFDMKRHKKTQKKQSGVKNPQKKPIKAANGKQIKNKKNT